MSRPKKTVKCADKCYSIGEAIIFKNFIVGCKKLSRCPGDRYIKPGQYSMYRDKIRRAG